MACELLGELAAILEAQHPGLGEGLPNHNSPTGKLQEPPAPAQPLPPAPRSTVMTVFAGPVPAAPPQAPRDFGSAFCQASWSAYTTHTQMAGFKASRGAAPRCSKAWGLHKPLVIFVFLFVRNCFIVLSVAWERQASLKTTRRFANFFFVRKVGVTKDHVAIFKGFVDFQWV